MKHAEIIKAIREMETEHSTEKIIPNIVYKNGIPVKVEAIAWSSWKVIDSREI